MWSPETLIFALYLSAILCTGIFIIRVINLLPKLRMTIWKNGALAVSIAAYGLASSGDVNSETVVIDRADRIVVAEVAPFGMASRKPVPVPDPVEVVSVTVDNVQDSAMSPLYNVHCSACHGPNGEGIEGLGVDLVASEFVAGSDADALIGLLREGRMPDAEISMTGRPMPSFAWMGEDELDGLAVLLRNKASVAGNQR